MVDRLGRRALSSRQTCAALLASGVIFRLYRRLGVGVGRSPQCTTWLPTGGHVEPGENPRATVQREAREELGIDARFLFAAPLMLTIAETQGLSVRHTDVSLWYVLTLDPEAVLRPDRAEFSDVRWFAFDDVPYERSDPNMERFVRKLKSALQAL
jgi:8-oxo-dGTP pyrophosphatase MutT (NUDIX family)